MALYKFTYLLTTTQTTVSKHWGKDITS